MRIPAGSCSRTSCFKLAMFVLVFGQWSCLAWGALGGPIESVRADQLHMKASISILPYGAYRVEEIRTPTGTAIREYVSAAGTVFAVTWRGPLVPDMRQILGRYFERYSNAVRAPHASGAGRRFLDMRDLGFVVQMAGHQRAYAGRAYDLQLLPRGVTPNDLR